MNAKGSAEDFMPLEDRTTGRSVTVVVEAPLSQADDFKAAIIRLLLDGGFAEDLREADVPDFELVEDREAGILTIVTPPPLAAGEPVPA